MLSQTWYLWPRCITAIVEDFALTSFNIPGMNTTASGSSCIPGTGTGGIPCIPMTPTPTPPTTGCLPGTGTGGIPCIPNPSRRLLGGGAGGATGSSALDVTATLQMKLASENKWTVTVRSAQVDAMYKGVILSTGSVSDLDIPSEGVVSFTAE